VKRFMRAHSLVYCMGTHQTQRKPEEVAAEALDYMNLIRTLVLGPHCGWRYILNMDQTHQVYFCMTRKKTLEVVGVKTIHILTSTSNTKRATVTVTIVFKGKPDGRIARTEFGTYPPTHHYHCQDSAWMDERVMLAWVDEVLKLCVADAPEHVIPILILSSYRCHMMASVVTKIQELGIEVKHIPGGCTFLCQPVDVGFNKPFKDCIRRQWVSWMIAEGVIHGTTSPPMRRDVATWVDRMMAEMKSEVGIIRNTWLKTGYE
jgi:hypothetical protein